MTNWSLVSQEFAARRQAEGTQAYMQGVDRLSRGIDTAYGAFRDQQQIALSAQAQAFDQQLALRRQEMQDEENRAQIALLEQRRAEGAMNLEAAQALLQAGINEEMALTQKATLRAQRLQAEKMASDIEGGVENRERMISDLLRMTPEMAEMVGLTVGKGANGDYVVTPMTDQQRALLTQRRKEKQREQIGISAARSGLPVSPTTIRYIETGQMPQQGMQGPGPEGPQQQAEAPDAEKSTSAPSFDELTQIMSNQFGLAPDAVAPYASVLGGTYLSDQGLAFYKQELEKAGGSYTRSRAIRDILRALRMDTELRKAGR